MAKAKPALAVGGSRLFGGVIDMANNNTKMPLDVVCVGNIMVDILFTALPRPPALGEELRIDTYSIDVGGGAAITALALAKLGYKSAIASAAGDDVFGRFLGDSLLKNGVDLTCLHILRGHPTTLSIEFSFPTDRATLTASSFHGGVVDEAFLTRQLAAARHLHMLGLDNAKIRLLEFAVSEGITTSVDTNMNCEAQHQLVKRGAPFIDLLMPNRHEVPIVDGDLNATVKMVGGAVRGVCIVKAGEEGAIASDGRSLVRAAAFSSSVVDTTGAGDAFNAGYLSAFLRDYDTEECLAIGNAMGAFSVEAAGGTRGLPTCDQLRDFVAQRGLKFTI